MKRFCCLLALLVFPLFSQAQTIGLNQVVAAEFNSVAEFQNLSAHHVRREQARFALRALFVRPARQPQATHRTARICLARAAMAWA